MNRYEHTVQNDQEALAYQIEQIVTETPDIIFVGSLGRAAITGDVFLPRAANGKLRDVDILDARPPSAFAGKPAAARSLRPHDVDEAHHKWLDFKPGEAFLVSPFDRGYNVAVDPVVFAAESATVLGVTVPVLNPRTQWYLDRLEGPLRPKDIVPQQVFSEAIAGRQDLLPDELFEPFHQFAAVVGPSMERERRMSERFSFVPAGVRKAALPIAQPIMQRVARLKKPGAA